MRRLVTMLRGQPRAALSVTGLLVFFGCSIAGAAIIDGLGPALIVAGICGLVLATLFGLEEEDEGEER